MDPMWWVAICVGPWVVPRGVPAAIIMLRGRAATPAAVPSPAMAVPAVPSSLVAPVTPAGATAPIHVMGASGAPKGQALLPAWRCLHGPRRCCGVQRRCCC
jgi:hypothetical protein